MRRFSAAAALATLAFVTSAQESEIEITLTRGTVGLGVHLVSEARGRGAVVERVVPGSAASLGLRRGDAFTRIAGIDIRKWSLDGIERLLEIQGKVKVQIRRQAEEIPDTPDIEEGVDPQGDKSASCYTLVEGDTDNLHALECIPASFGRHLPAFFMDNMGDEHETALPVMIAQPLEFCETNTRFNASGHALLVSRGGCLPHVKALIAARSGAELLFVIDGQFPPFPSLPRTSDQRMLSPLTSTHLSAQMVNIPVLVIRNETGHRIMEEILENRRNVMIFSHAGDRPSRFKTKPRNQVNLAEAEALHPANNAFDLASTFRDGEVGIAFGTPGLPGGEERTIMLGLTYELSALLTGQKQTVPYTRNVLCPICHGKGATEANMRPCKICSASGEPGIWTVTHDHSHEVKQTLKRTCLHCHGFGEVPRRGGTCSRCMGDRVISQRASVEVTIPKGVWDPYTFEFLGFGSQSAGKTTGAVKVVAMAKPHDIYIREGANLRTEFTISVTEALSGFSRDLQLLNGSTISINKTGMTNNLEDIEIAGAGLPHWDPTSAHERHGRDYDRQASGLNTAIGEANEASGFGSVFVTCTVVFPDKLVDIAHEGRQS